MTNLETLTGRPTHYYNIDGVGELGMGFMLTSGSTIQWLQTHSAPNSIWNQSYSFFVLWFLVIGIIHFGSRAIKNHITYPRTGYVEYRKRDTVWLPMILGSTVAALVSYALAIIVLHHLNLTILVAMVGLFFAALYSYRLVPTAPWKWSIAAAMALASLAAIVVPPSWFAALAGGSHDPRTAQTMGTLLYFFATFGILFVVSGAISFWLYLHHTQPPVAEAQ